MFGRNYFLGQCYRHVRALTPFAPLADRALELVFGTDSTGGHILQSCGATQMFLRRFPEHLDTLRDASPLEPYQLRDDVLADWLRFFRNKQGTYGHPRLGYDWDVLHRYLITRYGGTRRRGGGAKNEFEIVLRLVAEFIENPRPYRV